MFKNQLKEELHTEAYIAPVATVHAFRSEGVICGSVKSSNIKWYEDDEEELSC